jgi:hypothetical protein
VAGSVYLGLPAVAGEIANRTRWLRGSVVYPAAALRALAGWTPAGIRVEVGGRVFGRDLPAAADGETLDCAAPLRSAVTLRIRAVPGALRALVPSGA